ncbi:SGNH/GDSL hydrolase family protein [Bradyrhizobium icense]|nr:SGNH/GDSL hydrolase family protein [Bradyrhizobium icense]
MSYNRFFIVTFVLCWTIIAFGRSSFGAPVRLGIMGDSNSDEYRADENNRGGIYASTTLNWSEQLQRYRGIEIGSWGSWSGTRRSGYEYNWALTGATAEDVVKTGQAAGLAQQVAAGKVNTVVLYVGANDFAIWNNTYANIYNGVLAGQSLKDYINRIVSSVAIAIDTVRTTEAVNMIVANLQDRGQSLGFIAHFPDPAKRQAVTNAIIAVNAGIDNVVRARRNVALVDLYNYVDSPKYKSRINLARGTVTVGREQISFATPGDEPHHAMLSDDEHSGAVVQCLLANYIFIGPLNSKFGQRIRPFTDEECLTNAGILVRGR